MRGSSIEDEGENLLSFFVQLKAFPLHTSCISFILTRGGNRDPEQITPEACEQLLTSASGIVICVEKY